MPPALSRRHLSLPPPHPHSASRPATALETPSEGPLPSVWLPPTPPLQANIPPRARTPRRGRPPNPASPAIPHPGRRSEALTPGAPAVPTPPNPWSLTARRLPSGPRKAGCGGRKGRAGRVRSGRPGARAAPQGARGACSGAAEARGRAAGEARAVVVAVGLRRREGGCAVSGRSGRPGSGSARGWLCLGRPEQVIMAPHLCSPCIQCGQESLASEP